MFKELFQSEFAINDLTFDVIFSSQGLVFLGTKDDPIELNNKFSLNQITQVANSHEFVQLIQKELSEYFSNRRQTFDIPLDYFKATDFQKEVWQALSTITFGQLISYQQLAQLIFRPKAYRAVATAVAQNPYIIIIPCHRVIRSNGQVGLYRSGVELKRQLLALEGHTNL